MTSAKTVHAENKDKPLSAEKSLLRKMFDLSSADGQKYFDIFAFAVLLLLMVWGIVIVFFSTGYAIDEAFYLTIPERILAGDGLLTDEWQLSQLSSVLLLPCVWLWNVTADSTEGMYMFFSVLFCVVRGLFCGALYFLLRKYRFFTLVGASCLSQFATMNYNALSYNTIGLYAVILLMCLCVRLTQRKKKITAVLCGFLYAVIILCNPVAISLFPFFCILALIFFLKSKLKKHSAENSYYLITPQGFSCFVAGILPVFIYFCIVLFANSSLKDIIASLPYIMQDPEHMVLADGSGQSTVQGFGMLTELTDNLGVAVFVIAVIISALCIFCKKYLPMLCLPLVTAQTALLLCSAQVHYFSSSFETENPGLIYFAFFLEGILLFFIGDRKNRPVFYAFICGGLFYAVCMEISSNLGYQAHINGYISALPGTLILLSDCLTERKDEKKAEKTSLICVGLSLFLAIYSVGFYSIGVNGSVFFNRSVGIFEIQSGFYKGKKMVFEDYQNYVYLKSDMTALDEIVSDTDKLFVFGNLPHTYLETEKLGMASMSGWLYPELQLQSASARQRFFAYYEMYPDNIPDYIYVPFFDESSDTLKNLNAKKNLEMWISPYFSGEAIELNHGIALKVDKILYTGENLE